MTSLSLYLMSAFYLIAGVMHFIKPGFYKNIIPPALGNKDLINWVSGAAEVLLGIGLLTEYQPLAAWGLVALLIAVFPANIYHLQQKGAGMNIPMWVLWMRLPLQFVLIWWAYLFT